MQWWCTLVGHLQDNDWPHKWHLWLVAYIHYLNYYGCICIEMYITIIHTQNILLLLTNKSFICNAYTAYVLVTFLFLPFLSMICKSVWLFNYSAISYLNVCITVFTCLCLFCCFVGGTLVCHLFHCLLICLCADKLLCLYYSSCLLNIVSCLASVGVKSLSYWVQFSNCHIMSCNVSIWTHCNQ